MARKTLCAFMLASLGNVFTPSPLRAEYRVYQYYVRGKVANLNNPPATVVTSTLNPTNYAAFHGGKLSLEVNLLRSWVCFGDTSKKPPCSMSEGRELSEGFIQ